MKEKLKSLYQTSKLGFIFIGPFARIYQYFLHKKYLSREAFVKQRFKKCFGYELNLNDPQTLNEKINWLKLNYWNPLSTQMVDKFEVRNYISKNIGDEYLVPLLYTTENPRDIISENLPDIACIIKTNHDSSGGIIVRNKSEVKNWKEIQNRLHANMSQNFYWDGREKPYRNIKPRIIAEKLLTDNSGTLPADYKVHCFNGKTRMINVDMGRGTKNHYRNWYSSNWKREPYKWSSVLGDGTLTDPSEKDVPKPELLEKMLLLSEKLAKGFPYLRVDWYIFNNQLYFGELTFHHNGGHRPIYPESWDLKLGQELDLK
ncbi:ATP-grasp fold amidoligase family protein [Maribacter arcticus]|uniref:TupA-like ATPgrasp n=1 Tax=Maribacter arcticus TaxID=561365 RepID=A0A1T5BGK0_9FLAO|nr:ATP-grasp fold amidoligase family protein [Maribacter arcticus]SKB46422.1 TupA-like ATPgrasp [Maribacter arcticus]